MVGTFYLAVLAVNKNRRNKIPRKNVSSSVTQYPVNGHTPLVYLNPCRHEQFLNGRVCFNTDKIIGSVFLPLKVVPMRIHISSKGQH